MKIRYTKLDAYDYFVMPIEMDYVDIQIRIDGNTDVTIADIASELTVSDGNIYLEGYYYTLDDIQIIGRVMHIFCRPQQ